jgi:sarcosine oxidase delta subunit
MKTDMEQRDQNRDSTDTEPKYQQQSRKESNSEIVVVEQESGKQEEVQHRGRGKYNQYEAAEVIIEKIRSYRTQRYPDSEIMKFLDNMPRRTYYNYVKKLQEQDGQIMEQWMAENVEHVSEEMMIYRETLCQKLREVQAIIDNKNTSAKDKMQAIEQHLAISEKLVKFTKSGRSSDMNSAKLDRFSIL